MTKDRLVALLFRRATGELTPDETRALEEWAEKATENRGLLNKVSNEETLMKELELWEGLDPAAGYQKWSLGESNRHRRRVRLFVGWSAAASLLIAIAIFVLLKDSRSAVSPPVAAAGRQIMPGRNTATLTLASGRQILLDSAANGDLVQQSGARLVKEDSGSISYQASGKTENLAYNTLSTPRSGEFQLTLADGSRVWLNNASSLRYPTAFNGDHRVVELTGEAYFEIAPRSSQPFVVRVGGESIEVLGTSFNVMAYADEAGTQTTLLTGAVRVSAGGASVQLKPDDQSLFDGTGGLEVLHGVPSRDIVSWKDGFFYFGRASFAAVMRQLARWYDVDVVYEGKAPEMEFGGKIDRSLPLNELLRFLDKNQIRFRLEGRKLIVLPN